MTLFNAIVKADCVFGEYTFTDRLCNSLYPRMDTSPNKRVTCARPKIFIS